MINFILLKGLESLDKPLDLSGLNHLLGKERLAVPWKS
jgi:hypothetical protein